MLSRAVVLVQLGRVRMVGSAGLQVLCSILKVKTILSAKPRVFCRALDTCVSHKTSTWMWKIRFRDDKKRKCTLLFTFHNHVSRILI